MRFVWVDPDGFISEDWMAVLVPLSTGVAYRHQYGGTACLHGEVEGYLVPVFNRVAYDRLRSLFEDTLGGAGTSRRLSWAWDLLDILRQAVSGIRMAPSDGEVASPSVSLSLDESRLLEANEAWIPVVTPDGRGILIWPNSD